MRLRSLDASDTPRREALHLLGIRSYELPETTITTAAQAIRSDRRRWVEFMMKFELGLAEPDPARALELDGHRVEVALDGTAGVAIERATARDVAFIDIGLPGVDNPQLGRRIRAAGNES